MHAKIGSLIVKTYRDKSFGEDVPSIVLDLGYNRHAVVLIGPSRGPSECPTQHLLNVHAELD